MPATLTGRVFNNLSNNGQSAGNPGIPGALHLYHIASDTAALPLKDGSYAFSVDAPGHYILYNPTASDNGRPLSDAAQPDGAPLASHTENIPVTITQAQIDSNAQIGGLDFCRKAESYGKSNAPYSDSVQPSSLMPEVQPENAADLSVKIEALQNPAVPGQQLRFSMSIENIGPGTAENVLLYDAAGPELTAVEFSMDQGETWLPWINPYQIGPVASGNIIRILFQGIVHVSAQGTLMNTAVITSVTPDANPSNNIATEIVNIRAQADISIIKEASQATVRPCERIVYTLRAANAGPSEAEEVVITDEIANGEYCINGGQWLPWMGSYAIGRLQAGQTAVIQLRVQTPPDAAGVIENTSKIRSVTPDPDPGNNTSTVFTVVEGVADLAITKMACPNQARPCQQIVYRITVTNQGPSGAEDVIITDDIPPSLCRVRYSTDRGRTWRPWCGQLYVGYLPNGGSVSILIAGYIDRRARGCITNCAYVSSSTTDCNPGNNCASVASRILPGCVLQGG